MTYFLIDDFDKRRNEVRRYVAFLVLIEKKAVNHSYSPKFHNDLKVQQASTFLLLYNLIESSARQGLLAIHDAITTEEIKFENSVNGIRKRILGDFKNNVSGKFSDTINDLSIDIVKMAFDSKKKAFNGNVDARKLKEASKEYGFSIKIDDKGNLLKVKNQRQNLAHGELAFSEVGKDYTSGDIRDIYKISTNYMRCVLVEISDYIQKKGFVDSKY